VYRYRGEQYDPDLNLYYLRARYFNPLTGRFLTRDRYVDSCRSPQSNPAQSWRFLGMLSMTVRERKRWPSR
jgi:RHS repeat-associated protein